MKLSRRRNPLPPHWYCHQPGCIDQGGAGFGVNSQAEAEHHTELTGHKTSVFVSSEIIYSRTQLQAVKM